MLLGLLKDLYSGTKRTSAPDAIRVSEKDSGGRAAPKTKYNMGCGHHKIAGHINVDASAVCQPDMVFDLESLPWPFDTSSADEVVFNHSLEHMGQTPKIFLGIMQELYRISKDGAEILINVPHPRHDYFINDPTHVRPITPLLLRLFDKDLNDEWKKSGIPNTPLAHYLDVNFKLVFIECVLDEPYKTMRQQDQISNDEIHRMLRELNNIAEEYRFKLIVIKS